MSIVEEYQQFLYRLNNEYQNESLDFFSDFDKKILFLTEEIIGIVTYDDDITLEIGKKIYKTILAVLKNKQLEIVQGDFYADYILCLNLIGIENFDWGTSIRFCWFEDNEKVKKIKNTIKFIFKEEVQIDNENNNNI